jgi:hypothetical protein
LPDWQLLRGFSHKKGSNGELHEVFRIILDFSYLPLTYTEVCIVVRHFLFLLDGDKQAQQLPQNTSQALRRWTPAANDSEEQRALP